MHADMAWVSQPFGAAVNLYARIGCCCAGGARKRKKMEVCANARKRSFRQEAAKKQQLQLQASKHGRWQAAAGRSMVKWDRPSGVLRVACCCVGGQLLVGQW